MKSLKISSYSQLTIEIGLQVFWYENIENKSKSSTNQPKAF